VVIYSLGNFVSAMYTRECLESSVFNLDFLHVDDRLILDSVSDIRVIIQKIAYLVDTEGLPTDFTRFRRMTERRDSLGEMSKEQAALIGAALKFIQIP
jgi:hypothetical protein